MPYKHCAPTGALRLEAPHVFDVVAGLYNRTGDLFCLVNWAGDPFPHDGSRGGGELAFSVLPCHRTTVKRDTRARGRAGEFSCLGTFALLLYQRAGPGSPCSLPTERRCSHSQWLWVSAFSYGRP